MTALKERDPYSYGHCRRVAWLARSLAEASGLPKIEQDLIEYSSMFHDLGRLTAEEETIMREHPVKSVEILKPLSEVKFFSKTIPGILHHHERIDGLGYPFGIKGEAIPLIARIILIADTFDAMTTTRPYRKGMDQERAFKELKIFSGRQFDKHLVDIFLKAYPTWQKFDEEITEAFVSTHFKRAA